MYSVKALARSLRRLEIILKMVTKRAPRTLAVKDVHVCPFSTLLEEYPIDPRLVQNDLVCHVISQH
jgi:hypothetical protein